MTFYSSILLSNILRTLKTRWRRCLLMNNVSDLRMLVCRFMAANVWSYSFASTGRWEGDDITTRDQSRDDDSIAATRLYVICNLLLPVIWTFVATSAGQLQQQAQKMRTAECRVTWWQTNPGQNPLGYNDPSFLPCVGRLWSVPRLVGRIGSGVRVNPRCQKIPGRVLSHGDRKGLWLGTWADCVRGVFDLLAGHVQHALAVKLRRALLYDRNTVLVSLSVLDLDCTLSISFPDFLSCVRENNTIPLMKSSTAKHHEQCMLHRRTVGTLRQSNGDSYPRRKKNNGRSISFIFRFTSTTDRHTIAHKSYMVKEMKEIDRFFVDRDVRGF